MTESPNDRLLPVIHLICNAHIDPVWLWGWEEGLAETLSTFRVAARFCEQHKGFVFCHNEALLYQWVEQYEPALFKRIRRLVGDGRWRIIGGWYLQPDCNLPSGEALARQILNGRSYFRRKFNVEPTTAVNFDPFGHSRGLVQILRLSGYDSYLFCRPGLPHLDVPNDFIWIGFDGSEVLAHRSLEHYNSERGQAAAKLSAWLLQHPAGEDGLFLWGIGNHGGGPSEEDLVKIYDLQLTIYNWKLRHSWPERYFEEEKKKDKRIKMEGDLNPWAVGCYTSMSRVKRKYRQLEESLLLTEKLISHAAASGLMKPPRRELAEAWEDLLFCQFHDILPGSGIPEVEELAIRKMDHGLEILSRLKTGAFFQLLAGQPAARPGDFPILIYNAEPADIETTIEVELQPPEPNFNPNRFLLPVITDEEGQNIDYQLEKEESNIANDHRKRIVFNARLRASSMNRFCCLLQEADIAEKPTGPVQRDLSFSNGECDIEIDPVTGLMNRYRVRGTDYLRPGAFQLLVMRDSADPWGMQVDSFREVAGAFRLATQSETAALAGTDGPVLPIRIIEEGPVRTVVEGLFRHNGSAAVVRYRIPAHGTDFELEIRVFWMEKDRMLKLSVPTRLDRAECLGQVMYGVQRFEGQGLESVSHRWCGLFDEVSDQAVTIINQTTYGFDHSDGEIRLSLLRSPAYAGHPVGIGTPVVQQDRFTPRIDQGEHLFRFRISAGNYQDRVESIDLESRMFNQPPVALCCYPTGRGRKPESLISISNPVIRLAALKPAESDSRFIIRLFNPTDRPRETHLTWRNHPDPVRLLFRPFEIKTLSAGPDALEPGELNLMEEPKKN